MNARRTRRWESAVIDLLAYPANLAFAGLAAFLLALPVVTWLIAVIAAGRALSRWSVDDDGRVFTNTFREFRVVWRRALSLSVTATAIVAVLIANLLFLGDQDTPVAFLFGMATLPVVVVFVLVVVLLPAATVHDPGRSATGWLRLTVTLASGRPAASFMLAVIVIGFALTCLLLPTIAPFFGLSIPAWLGLVTVGRR